MFRVGPVLYFLRQLARSGRLRTDFTTGRYPLPAKIRCCFGESAYLMNALAAAGAFFVTTIGSWISIVGLGTMSFPFWPLAKAAYASLSYVMRTSPLPEKNVFAAFEPDESCETTFLKSLVTNWTALWLFIPDLRAAP